MQVRPRLAEMQAHRWERDDGLVLMEVGGVLMPELSFVALFVENNLDKWGCA